MNDTSPEDKKKSGIDVDTATFDVNGAVEGIDQSILDSVSGGVQEENWGCGELPNNVC